MKIKRALNKLDQGISYELGIKKTLFRGPLVVLLVLVDCDLFLRFSFDL